MGTSVPIAAAVAEATIGLASDLHIPNGNTLTIGLLSRIFATGTFDNTRFDGKTTSADGVNPKVHFNKAPKQTC
jgi:hypothetical protein